MNKDKNRKPEIVDDDNKRLFSDPDLLLDHLNGLVQEYCDKWHFDIENIRPLQFSAVLDHLYLHFFKPNKYLMVLNNYKLYKLDENNNMVFNNPICNKYDFNIVMYIYNIYKKLCNNYSMIISIDGFSTLTGISEEIIYRWSNGLETGATPEQLQFAKIILRDKEKSLESALMDKSVNPIKPIAILNHRYGWSMPGVTRETREAPALTAEQLPNLSALPAQNAQNIALPPERE